jgi:DNA-binding NtrC family response regulator
MNNDSPVILILDDDTAVRNSLVDHFQDQGWRPLAVARGEEALDLLTACPTRVAIVDIRLETITGDVFIREALQRQPDLYFVVCTGSPTYEISEDLRNEPRVSPTIFFKPVRSLFDLEKEARRLLLQSGPTRSRNHGLSEV